MCRSHRCLQNGLSEPSDAEPKSICSSLGAFREAPGASWAFWGLLGSPGKLLGGSGGAAGGLGGPRAAHAPKTLENVRFLELLKRGGGFRFANNPASRGQGGVRGGVLVYTNNILRDKEEASTRFDPQGVGGFNAQSFPYTLR